MKMRKTKMQVGIIGIGSFSAARHVPNLKDTGRAEIAALCRRNPELLEVAGKAFGVANTYTDWHRMLDETELDAVVVSTPKFTPTLSNPKNSPTMVILETGIPPAPNPNMTANTYSIHAFFAQISQNTIPARISKQTVSVFILPILSEIAPVITMPKTKLPPINPKTEEAVTLDIPKSKAKGTICTINEVKQILVKE